MHPKTIKNYPNIREDKGQSQEIILGIDPGSRVTGYGLIQANDLTVIDFGAIRPSLKLSLEERYLAIFEGVEELILHYQPNIISVETQFVQKNVQSAIKLGMARGAILIAAAKYKIKVYEYTPKKAKLAVTGRGSADKLQVQTMVQRLLKLKEPPYPEDAADALAIAICHANNKRFSHV
jgi:crossover junction endodeoxyribonuclease RuvC